MALYFVFFLFLLVLLQITEQRSFTIDYVNNRFLKDNLPFTLIGGAVSYFTIPPDYWEDRLIRVRSMGINTVQMNIAWNIHETYEGHNNFDGWADIFRFLTIANKLGLLVSLRPGPYVDAELDFGGFPYWLLNYPDIKLRTSDPNFVNFVRRWFNVLLPLLIPFLYENGGPIITVQVENEYGSYPACDQKYVEFLRDLIRKHFGPNVLLISTDGPNLNALNCAAIPGVFPTLDFGVVEKSQLSNIYKDFRSKVPLGPFVNSEFYTGWLDVWSVLNHHRLNGDFLSDNLQLQWSFNTSVTFYMVVGGTFYGHLSGSLLSYPDGKFTSVTTSYDYDAPISESGDLTQKYFILRSNIETYLKSENLFPIPKNSPKIAYEPVMLFKIGSILSLLDILCPPNEVTHSEYPLTFEQLQFPYGFVLYRTIAKLTGSTIRFPQMNDRAYVVINGEFKRTIQRSDGNNKFLQQININDKIDILVENQGRLCYGPNLLDKKGIVGNLTISGQNVTGWKIYPLSIMNIYGYLINNLALESTTVIAGENSNLPSFYAGVLQVDNIADTFINPIGWGKGQVFVNGHNLGRYWPTKGPQITLYLPAPFLRTSNLIVVFEHEKAGNCDFEDQLVCQMPFSEIPLLL